MKIHSACKCHFFSHRNERLSWNDLLVQAQLACSHAMKTRELADIQIAKKYIRSLLSASSDYSTAAVGEVLQSFLQELDKETRF